MVVIWPWAEQCLTFLIETINYFINSFDSHEQLTIRTSINCHNFRHYGCSGIIGSISAICSFCVQCYNIWWKICWTEDRIVKSSLSNSHPSWQSSTPDCFCPTLRNDGKIWTGTVTFTASKSIEVEVLHGYKPQSAVDAEHGEPYYATLPNNKICHFYNDNVYRHPC